MKTFTMTASSYFNFNITNTVKESSRYFKNSLVVKWYRPELEGRPKYALLQSADRFRGGYSHTCWVGRGTAMIVFRSSIETEENQYRFCNPETNWKLSQEAEVLQQIPLPLWIAPMDCQGNGGYLEAKATKNQMMLNLSKLCCSILN